MKNIAKAFVIATIGVVFVCAIVALAFTAPWWVAVWAVLFAAALIYGYFGGRA